MEQPPNENIHIESKEKFKEPVTLEVLLQRKDLVQKILDKMTWADERWKKMMRYEQMPDGYDKVDFGDEFEAASYFTILYNVGYQLGFPAESMGDPNIRKYLELLVEDPAKAEEYVKEENKTSEAGQEWLRNSADLSKIIDGAPQIIQAELDLVPNDGKETVRPYFRGQNTPKVKDIVKVTTPEDKKFLENVFANKTVIDLGAGCFGDGIEVSDALKAKKYVGVEPMNTERLLYLATHYFTDTDTDSKLKNMEQGHIAKADMLTFLQHLPSNIPNAVIMMSGVDRFIVVVDHKIPTQFDYQRPIARKAGIQYMHDVFVEVKRVLGQESSFVSYASHGPVEIAREMTYDRVKEQGVTDADQITKMITDEEEKIESGLGTLRAVECNAHEGNILVYSK